jgi:hypothetical protein
VVILLLLFSFATSGIALATAGAFDIPWSWLNKKQSLAEFFALDQSPVHSFASRGNSHILQWRRICRWFRVPGCSVRCRAHRWSEDNFSQEIREAVYWWDVTEVCVAVAYGIFFPMIWRSDTIPAVLPMFGFYCTSKVPCIRRILPYSGLS